MLALVFACRACACICACSVSNEAWFCHSACCCVVFATPLAISCWFQKAAISSASLMLNAFKSSHSCSAMMPP
uniref:Uncharacterized protein n=1 Tax=uncultured marine microorganism HF4000_ANIW133B20 TaxID=455528 RepID=B3T3J5_9ZZZZ|nr:hypothetical protein ALOHA_HF4000ANIW133B20ctg2g6 [uncultured marine microorganism HF4000_ANIW133B20]